MTQEENDTTKLAGAFAECQIEETMSPSIILNETCDTELLVKFPKPKNKVPPVFLHKPVKFPPHMRKVLNLGIQFYRPTVRHNYTKICCKTFNDHASLLHYFENKNLPHHTYGLPQNREMKVVFRGLPEDVDLEQIKNEFGSVSIPIIRVHIMRKKENAEDLPVLVLAVVPNNDEGRKILLVRKLFGHSVTIEPPKPRYMQCFRCQKWGHTQRYCSGNVKCVKCGDDHLYKDCTKDPSKDPPRCANCGCDHTANFKLCPYSPNSPLYIEKLNKAAKSKVMFFGSSMLPRKLVTLSNCYLFMKERL